jgi:hypothetical protein
VADLRVGEPDWQRDHRDLMVALAPYRDCAVRLGMAVGWAFRAAAWRGPASVRPVVVAFGGREDVTLAAFGWVLEETEFGPSYVPSRPPADVERLERRFGRGRP